MIATNSHPSVVWNILIKVRMVMCTGRPCCLVMYTLSTKNDATINLENACISAIICLLRVTLLFIILSIILCRLQLSRLTVVSREAKKKQHACASSGPRDHYSELFTRMAALKF